MGRIKRIGSVSVRAHPSPWPPTCHIRQHPIENGCVEQQGPLEASLTGSRYARLNPFSWLHAAAIRIGPVLVFREESRRFSHSRPVCRPDEPSRDRRAGIRGPSHPRRSSGNPAGRQSRSRTLTRAKKNVPGTKFFGQPARPSLPFSAARHVHHPGGRALGGWSASEASLAKGCGYRWAGMVRSSM